MKSLIHQPNALLQNTMGKLAKFFKSKFSILSSLFFSSVNCKGKTVLPLQFVACCLVYGKTKYYQILHRK